MTGSLDMAGIATSARRGCAEWTSTAKPSLPSIASRAVARVQSPV